MNKLHQQLLKTIAENPDQSVSDVITSALPSLTRTIKSSLLRNAPEMLSGRQLLETNFIEKNQLRWGKAFELLEVHVVICTELAQNLSFDDEEAQDIVFSILLRLHATAIHIAEDIICLVKNGFADAADARWRALHEVNVTALFISKHGAECAERFNQHAIVDAYRQLIECNKYHHRLQISKPSKEEIDHITFLFKNVETKYGKRFTGQYGWADYLFPNHQGKNVGFAAIEKDVGLDHMRPYYKRASMNIHTNFNGMVSKLGLLGHSTDALLIGRSDLGMADPIHATAISLCQISSRLMSLQTTLDHVVIVNILNELQELIGETLKECIS
ncbi:hypothetical protein HRH59_13065 [Rheinheimera sp. YQF-2]|uniref:Uncharacterized protein n=1 Tax=Rheinheimera lutimaris TaxID=2740584 RepID=A0A7Y5ASZ4_9GAMM|nr:DUF5677 domain-containing protein [Rheinheimera lutimaris]NRQ43479.1 hypothetical protein [Rheinheimera lutimaris]